MSPRSTCSTTAQALLLRVLPAGDEGFPELPGAKVVVNPCLSGGALEVFLEPQLPPPLLIVVGETPISDAVVAQAESLGFAFAAVRTLEGQQPEGAVAVIIASHGSDEPESIRAALNADVRFIGLVASRRRGEAVLDAMDLTKEERDRVHTPVGLDIGARTAAEVALSIMAGVVRAMRTEGLVAPGPHVLPPPLRAVDPVCGMAIAVAPRHTASHRRRSGALVLQYGVPGPLSRRGAGTDVFVTGLVLAAGASRRLGQPKQLLAYRGTTVLGATLDMARGCGFDQLLVTVGGASAEVRDRIDFRDCQVVENNQFASGCSSSISGAVAVVDDRADGIILLLGDQPDISSGAVSMLLEGAGSSPLGVCRYTDGVGHPFWFRRQVFDDLRRAPWRQGGVEASRVRPLPGARGRDRREHSARRRHLAGVPGSARGRGAGVRGMTPGPTLRTGTPTPA